LRSFKLFSSRGRRIFSIDFCYGLSFVGDIKKPNARRVKKYPRNITEAKKLTKKIHFWLKSHHAKLLHQTILLSQNYREQIDQLLLQFALILPQFLYVKRNEQFHEQE